MTACTLVLNSNFQAVDVASWERAISLLFQGAAQVVDHDCRTFDFADWCELSSMMKDHPNGFVHSTSLRVAIPEVIRLTQYDRIPKNTVVFTKRNIVEYYNGKCCYCGHKFSTTDLTFDHVMPKSRGGGTNWENIVLACFDCNGKKDDRTPKEAGMKMHYQPSKPKHQSPVKRMIVKLPLKTKDGWQRFVDRAYWNSELSQD